MRSIFNGKEEKLLHLLKNLLSFFLSFGKARKREKVLAPSKDIDQDKIPQKPVPPKKKNLKYIWCDGERVLIDWPKVVTHKEEEKWKLPEKCMRLRLDARDELIDKFVVHWDGCLSSEMCHKVLESRGLSVHFCIDNDGTIIQLMDTNNIAWHARGVNTKSIGVEVSNAVYTKYAKKYKPARPVWNDVECHGKQIGPILGFTDEQVKALKVLTKTVCERYKIPLAVPLNDNGELIKGVTKSWKTFKGVMAHYHLNKGKTDPAGLDLKEVVKDD
jgi:hypothetical protein